MKPLRGSESWSHCVELIMRTIAGQRGSHSMCYSVVHVQRDIEYNVTEANRWEAIHSRPNTMAPVIHTLKYIIAGEHVASKASAVNWLGDTMVFRCDSWLVYNSCASPVPLHLEAPFKLHCCLCLLSSWLYLAQRCSDCLAPRCSTHDLLATGRSIETGDTACDRISDLILVENVNSKRKKGTAAPWLYTHIVIVESLFICVH